MQVIDIRQYLGVISFSAMSRIFKRLRLYGIIDQLKETYKYFLTAFDKEIIVARFTVGNLVQAQALEYFFRVEILSFYAKNHF